MWFSERLAFEVLSVVEEIPPGQRRLLEEEGVAFKENGCVDMRKCQWEC